MNILNQVQIKLDVDPQRDDDASPMSSIKNEGSNNRSMLQTYGNINVHTCS